MGILEFAKVERKRLNLFHQMSNKMTPNYTRLHILILHGLSYRLRRRSSVGQVDATTENFQPTFYHHCLSEWKLDPQIKFSLPRIY